ncbi:MAG: ribonuclease D [Propionibacteriaceae bacterium]|jgi:ribonuclease D|nr:ribonuclease D [Propionibacteriaceae bacterium]
MSEPTAPSASPASSAPTVIADDEALAAILPALSADTGPLSADTERAAGFRYSQRAYLIQLKTASTGVHLIDPIDISPEAMAALDQAVVGKEWILHAATQDLPSLQEAGLNPTVLFDTELAARLLGRERVGLGPLVEDVLGVTLAKDHGYSDWSTRPLPADWLTYAGLDVEYLIELRDALQDELIQAGKEEWARQEFAHALKYEPTPLDNPWRRTSDIPLVRTRRGLGVLRELWLTRDEIAAALDLSPHRIVNDRAISAVASHVDDSGLPNSRRVFTTGSWSARIARNYTNQWLDAVSRGMALSASELPPMKVRREGPPSPGMWAKRDPEAAQRWDVVRPVIKDLAEEITMPVENLISPRPLRALLWRPVGTSVEALSAQLADLDVRPWQAALVAPLIAQALADMEYPAE